MTDPVVINHALSEHGIDLVGVLLNGGSSLIVVLVSFFGKKILNNFEATQEEMKGDLKRLLVQALKTNGSLSELGMRLSGHERLDEERFEKIDSEIQATVAGLEGVKQNCWELLRKGHKEA